ncbi:MAG: GNAT family N-acetyltransferase [Clostridia bacterium]|nr:GNAT family N-acetyltransferase [Clostridia bacterium]
MNITYKTDKALPNEQLYDLFVSVGWADKNNTTQSMIDNFNKNFINSTIVISAWVDEKLVGCVRVLSDKMFRSVIYDLAVLPEFHGNGIGRELVRRCKEHYPDSEWLVQTTADKADFYKHIGFEVNNDVFLTVPCKLF